MKTGSRVERYGALYGEEDRIPERKSKQIRMSRVLNLWSRVHLVGGMSSYVYRKAL